ncbi:MAG: ATP-binding protein [Coriobacteriia bacterium]|nr:ATP-binding protein [Coriobacteriia bacterium]
MAKRVLIVDDDESGRYLISSLLKGSGYEVVEAVDGADALRKAREAPVDAVVSDILMPVMDGYQLCREWKSDPELAVAPLIFYSATYTDPADKRFAEGLGADGFFIKPQEPDALLAGIEEIMRSHAEHNLPGREPSLREETEVLREYNERLVSKLEQKLVELNRANRDLRSALEVLSDEVEVKKTLIEQLTDDVAVRAQEHRALSEMNELLGKVVASAPLAILAVDLDWTVRTWNPGAERLLGWSADDVIGSVYPPAVGRTDEFDRVYEPILSGRVPVMQVEVVRARKDGTPADLRVYAATLNGPDGSTRGLISVFTDITSERQIEMVKSDFLSMVSHELRTPLTSIIGYSDLLEQVDLERKPELFHQLLGKIRDRGNRMRTLIDNLLDVSQIQSGPLRLDLEPLDVADVVRTEAGRAELTESHRLVFDVDADLPPVFVDRQRIAKVVRHLLSNAVKYSPDGGDIRVLVKNQSGAIAISISDQGIGIDPSDVAHIFHNFTQADMSDTRSFGGIGVGLFLARQIVEAHRGHIEVSSKPGEGAVFTIVLPVLA